MKRLDENNPKERIIVCTNLKADANFPNSNLLCLGKRYVLKKISAGADCMNVHLEEFPDKVFNALCFSEIYSSFEEISEALYRKKRGKKLLAIVSNSFPTLVLGIGELKISPEWNIIQNLQKGEYYTIGLHKNCSYQICNQGYISELHCYIYKTEDNRYGIVDCSVYGTYILI